MKIFLPQNFTIFRPFYWRRNEFFKILSIGTEFAIIFYKIKISYCSGTCYYYNMNLPEAEQEINQNFRRFKLFLCQNELYFAKDNSSHGRD